MTLMLVADAEQRLVVETFVWSFYGMTTKNGQIFVAPMEFSD